MQHLFHHVDGVNDSSCNCIFGFVRSIIAETTLSHYCSGRAYSISIDLFDFVAVWDCNGRISTTGLFALSRQSLAGFLGDGGVLTLERIVLPVLASWSAPQIVSTLSCVSSFSAGSLQAVEILSYHGWVLASDRAEEANGFICIG